MPYLGVQPNVRGVWGKVLCLARQCSQSAIEEIN
jgi:hypothetical protein